MLRSSLPALAILMVACTSPSSSVAPEPAPAVGTASLEVEPLVEVREIKAPLEYPPGGRYFRIDNVTEEPVDILGYAPGNYVQHWQVRREGVLLDMPEAAYVGPRLRQVPLAPGESSIFRGWPNKEFDRVGIDVTQGDQSMVCWSR